MGSLLSGRRSVRCQPGDRIKPPIPVGGGGEEIFGIRTRPGFRDCRLYGRGRLYGFDVGFRDGFLHRAGWLSADHTRAERVGGAGYFQSDLGEPADLSRVALADAASPPIQVVRTNARILEFMPADVSKGSALATLALHLGIEPSAAVVFGDGENDIPMFEWAGVSVAMPRGWPLARARAKLVAPDGPAETAFARGVDLVLEAAGAAMPGETLKAPANSQC
jgi:hypothetical protein